MRYAPWILIALLIGLWASQDIPSPDLSEYERQVASARQELAEAYSRYSATADTLIVLRDSLDTVRQTARSERAKLRTRADSAETALRQVLDSLDVSTTVVDHLVDVHDQVVASLEEEIVGYQLERSILYRRVEVSDSVVSRYADLVAGVDAENAALRAALRKRSLPIVPVAIGVIAGVLLSR